MHAYLVDPQQPQALRQMQIMKRSNDVKSLTNDSRPNHDNTPKMQPTA